MDQLCRKIFSVRKTVLEMLRDRNYLVSTDLLNETFDSFKESFRRESYIGHELIFEYSHQIGHPDKNIVVIFNSESQKTPGVKQIQSYLEMLKKFGMCHAIIIWGERPPSTYAKKSIQTINDAGDIRIEDFNCSELIVNVTKHDLIPTHQKVPEEEKCELLEKFRAQARAMLQIQKNDPGARYLGLLPGDMVKITRNSVTSGNWIHYRVCV